MMRIKKLENDVSLTQSIKLADKQIQIMKEAGMNPSINQTKHMIEADKEEPKKEAFLKISMKTKL